MISATFSLLPVVVIYRCRWQDALSIQSLLSHYSGAIYIGDNSPADFKVDTASLPEHLVYQRAINNPGLSYHYNAAAHCAVTYGYTHLLLLDQDTLFPPHALEQYLQISESTIVAAPSLTTHTGAFSPATIDTWHIKAVSLPAGEHSLFDYAPVNSGLCVRVEDFLTVGGYNEKVALDFADFQFIRRIRQRSKYFTLLPLTVQQDFSNHQTRTEVLLPRFRLYLKSARYCEFDTTKAKWQHHYQVLRHTLALSLRTRSLRFLTTLFKHYLFQT